MRSAADTSISLYSIILAVFYVNRLYCVLPEGLEGALRAQSCIRKHIGDAFFCGVGD